VRAIGRIRDQAHSAALALIDELLAIGGDINAFSAPAVGDDYKAAAALLRERAWARFQQHNHRRFA